VTQQALLFVIDGSVGNTEEEKRTPVDDYLTLLNELKHYNKGALLAKPALIVRLLILTFRLSTRATGSTCDTMRSLRS
jgi:GTPase involved in cell partitioning and DNA repair